MTQAISPPLPGSSRSLVERIDGLAAPTDRWFPALACAGAAVTLGYALQISNGTVHPEAIRLLIVSLCLTFLAVAHPRLGFVERFGDSPAMVIFAGGLMLGLAVHLTTNK